MTAEKVYLDKLPLEEAYRAVYSSTPRLRFCERFQDKSELWNSKPHSHSYMELVYYINGKARVRHSGNESAYSLYDALVNPANLKHQDDVISAVSKEVICLWIDVPQLYFEEPVYLYENHSILKNAFEQVYREAKQEAPEDQLLEYAVKILLITILRMQKQSNSGEKVLDRTMGYLKEHYAQRLTLEDLASLEHISTSYLSRKFKQRTGVTVITYINRLRVEKAQQLLAASTISIDEIAYQTGFDSPKYFYRVFKSVTGESPAGFRRKYGHTV